MINHYQLCEFSKFTTLQAKCYARNFIKSDNDLINSGLLINSQDNPLLIIGRGSNILFTEPFQGTVIANFYQKIEIEELVDSYLVTATSGTSWNELVNYCHQREIFGLENMVLIPGTVGAGIIGNIGAYGNEIADFVEKVDLLDLTNGKRLSYNKQQCKFSYRHSIFKTEITDFYIINVVLRINKNYHPNLSHSHFKDITNLATAKDILMSVTEARQSKLPDYQRYGNLGSFFMNPIVDHQVVIKLIKLYPNLPYWMLNKQQSKLSAAWLIEQAGMKGFKFRTAQVSPQHALVLINNANCQAEITDLLWLAHQVQQAVKCKFAITLVPEVRFYGAKQEIDSKLFLENFNLE